MNIELWHPLNCICVLQNDESKYLRYLDFVPNAYLQLFTNKTVMRRFFKTPSSGTLKFYLNKFCLKKFLKSFEKSPYLYKKFQSHYSQRFQNDFLYWELLRWDLKIFQQCYQHRLLLYRKILCGWTSRFAPDFLNLINNWI